jgi:trk system potassium uptake protein TrkA
VDSFELSDDFSIIEATVPSEYVSKTLKEVGFRSKYNLLVLTIIKQVTVNPLLGSPKTENQVQGVASAEHVLEEGDILVLYGSNKDLQHFLKQKVR